MKVRMFGSVIKVNPVGVVVLLGAAFFFIYMYIDAYANSNQDYETVSLKRLLAVSIEAAEMGGKEVLSARSNTKFEVKSKGKTKEGANNPLTTGDVLSNRAILKTILNENPGLKVISEEHDAPTTKLAKIPKISTSRIDAIITEDRKVPIGDVTVWIDPLDATQEYTENLLQYVTTMVCVAVNGEPVIGVIHSPSINQTVWAWDGHGTAPTLKISSELEEKTTIIVSRSHAGKVESVARSALGEKVVVVPAGGAGYKVLQVISGKASAYIHVTLIKKWDICAGNAILNAVGGRMTTLGGSPIAYGAGDGFENSEGLLATKDRHEFFLSKFRNVAL